MSKGQHKLTTVSSRALPKDWPQGLTIGAKQSAGVCTCGGIFIADRKDDVQANYDLHVAQIDARGRGSTILKTDVRITCHYSENEDDAGYTDSIYVPLDEYLKMKDLDRERYVWQMIDERIGAEKERRANPPPEPTHEEQLAQHDRRSQELQAEWFRNEADKLDRILQESTPTDEA